MSTTWTSLRVSNKIEADNVSWTILVYKSGSSVIWRLAEISGLEGNGFTMNHPIIKGLYAEHTTTSLEAAVNAMTQTMYNLFQI